MNLTILLRKLNSKQVLKSFTFILTDMMRLHHIFFLFLDEYRLNFIFVKFSTKNFSHFITLNCYRITILPHYRTKSLKSNFLTPKSYSAPATVKFYTVSNFGRANKLQTSWKLESLVSNFTNKLQLISWMSNFSFVL